MVIWGSLFPCHFFMMCTLHQTISPLKTWKQQDLGFAVLKGEKFQSWKFTFCQFFYMTYYSGKRHDMKQCTTFKNHFLKNTCYLGHSKLVITKPFSLYFCKKIFKDETHVCQSEIWAVGSKAIIGSI